MCVCVYTYLCVSKMCERSVTAVVFPAFNTEQIRLLLTVKSRSCFVNFNVKQMDDGNVRMTFIVLIKQNWEKMAAQGKVVPMLLTCL